MPQQAIAFGRRVILQVFSDDVLGLSAELAYRFFLAMFPFAIFVASLGSAIATRANIQNPAEQLADQLAGTLPKEASTLVREELQRVIERQDAGLISFGILAAVFFATGGTNALIKAMNRAFDVEEQRPFWHRYLLAIGLTLLAGTAMIAAFALYVVGQVVADDAARRLGLSGVIWDVLPVLRLPVVIALVFGAVAVLYRLGPAMRLPFRWILPGAALFAVGWLLATFLFGLYVTEFSSYGSTYGALAGVAILLIWFYLSAFILLFGVEVNGVLAEWQDPEEVARRRAISEGH